MCKKTCLNQFFDFSTVALNKYVGLLYTAIELCKQS